MIWNRAAGLQAIFSVFQYNRRYYCECTAFVFPLKNYYCFAQFFLWFSRLSLVIYMSGTKVKMIRNWDIFFIHVSLSLSLSISLSLSLYIYSLPVLQILFPSLFLPILLFAKLITPLYPIILLLSASSPFYYPLPLSPRFLLQPSFSPILHPFIFFTLPSSTPILPHYSSLFTPLPFHSFIALLFSTFLFNPTSLTPFCSIPLYSPPPVIFFSFSFSPPFSLHYPSLFKPFSFYHFLSTRFSCSIYSSHHSFYASSIF